MKQPDPYLISICQQIETAHGNAIKTIADAKRLSDDFYAKKLHISPHTLGRLFGVVKPFRKPYKDTLNLLAHYLNFSEWEDFCQNQTNIPFDPNFFLTEAADGFSLALLQLALASHDSQALLAVLNKIDPNCPLTLQIAAAELLGTHLRKLPNKQPLLQLLASNPMGQRLFYESFVDEDDEGRYYSHALREYYLPNIQNNYRKLFVYAFLISKTVHHNKADSPYFDSFWHTTKQLTWDDCHFHEKSRWLEVAVLHDGINGALHHTWTNLLEKALQELKNHSPYEQAWVLARLLKALLLFDMKEELFGHQAFVAVVDQLVQNQKKGHHSIALYALQLFWLYANVKRNKKQVYAPFRIHSTWFQNEANEKKAIEFGISYLFATGENQKIVSQFLPEFCHATGNTWVTRLLY